MSYSNKKGNKIIGPRIVYDDGKFKFKCKFISQAKILEILTQEYNKFYNNLFDESKVNNEEIFAACLNIDILIRSSDDFKNKEYINYSLQCIFDQYLNKLYK